MEFKLRGYYRMPRKLLLDLFKRKITLSQFGLLQVYIGTADWDKRHKRKYAISEISNNKIGKIVGINKDKVAQEKMILNVKNYIELIKGNNNQDYVKVKRPSQYYSVIVSKTKDTMSKIKDT